MVLFYLYNPSINMCVVLLTFVSTFIALHYLLTDRKFVCYLITEQCIVVPDTPSFTYGCTFT